MPMCQECESEVSVRMLQDYGYYALYVCDDCDHEFYEEY